MDYYDFCKETVFDNLGVSDEKFKLYVYCLENIEKISGRGNSKEDYIIFQRDYADNANEFLNKQRNLLLLGKDSLNILEIGWNSWDSILFLLLGNDESKITCFDISFYKYVEPCYEFLKSVFGCDRIRLFTGPSTKSVPNFYNENNNEKFDLIHINGCKYILEQDFKNTYPMATKYILIDDYNMHHIKKLCDMYETQGLIENVSKTFNNFSETFIYTHSLFETKIGKIVDCT